MLTNDVVSFEQPGPDIKNIYILGVFTEKSYGKPLERNAVYIPVTTIESRDVSDVKINMALCNLIGRQPHHDVTDAVPQLAGKLQVNALLLQF